MSDRKLDLGNIMEQALRASSTKVPHPLEQRVEQLEALLREAECPNYKCKFDKAYPEWTHSEVPKTPRFCEWCAKRDELLTSQPHKV
jgi:hypothetical protein